MDETDRRQGPADGAKTANVQWHPGFCGAFRREFRKYRDYLRFEEELPLTVGSLFVDLLVIEILQPVPIENDLGQIFRKYNICEYKGPGDGLTIDDYYKTVAYACLYKCTGKTVDDIPAREITVSLIRDALPRKLFRTLEADEFTVAERWPGVFYLGHPGNKEGIGLAFPTQVIVTSRLAPKAHSGLRTLRRPADRSDVLRFLTEARQETDPWDLANVNAILSASVAANADLYARIRREIRENQEGERYVVSCTEGTDEGGLGGTLEDWLGKRREGWLGKRREGRLGER